MAYTEPVKFTSTDNYGCGPDDEDDVYTVSEFISRCQTYAFTDGDGFGEPVKGGLADTDVWIKPSKVPGCIPTDAEHIVWYNK